jgi:arachidonate 5-lipoxygenase
MYCLPQEASAEEQQQRLEEVAHRQTQYEWVTDSSYNPCLKSLPAAERDIPGVARSLGIVQDLGTDSIEAWFSRPVYLMKGLVRQSQPFDEYWEILPSHLTFYGFKRRIPRAYPRWRDDDFFAYCRLNGSNPLMIRPYTGPMAKFPVTDELVKGLLPATETLDSMTKANRLFYCDFPFLDKCPVDPEREGCFAAPIALFAVINGSLRPIAIQLLQDPTQSPIFTPNDNPGLWTLVKMHFNCADSVTQAWPWHFCSCHIQMESIYVASKRALSQHHPLYDLISQHGWYTMALNVPARTFLVGKPPVGVATPVYATGYDGLQHLAKFIRTQFDYRDLNPEVDLARRQVLDPNLLPGYYYRDDTLRVWAIIKQYVQELLDVIYPTEEHLLRDYEVQNWAKELGLVKAVNNPPVTVDPETGVWSFSSKAQFGEFLAIYIHTVSARHGAINMPLFDYHTYIPSAPAALTIKLPSDKNAVYSDEDIAKGLPGFRYAVRQVALMASLCVPPNEDHRLGHYRNEFPKHIPAAKPVVERFQAKLAELSKAIKARNEELPEGDRYPFLDPETIPCGIDI